jgi:predicted ester cyclase
VASGDTAVLEVTWKGTQTGPLTTAAGTIPASGKSQETPAAVFYVFEGAKIKASRHYFDAMTLLKQIGAEPK